MTLMQPTNTNFHAVIPYTNFAKEGWLQLCCPSHSIRFWPMRTNIFASVQLGPRTLWASGASDCDETDVERPEFDLPLDCTPPLKALEQTSSAPGCPGTGTRNHRQGLWARRQSDIVNYLPNAQCHPSLDKQCNPRTCSRQCAKYLQK